MMHDEVVNEYRCKGYCMRGGREVTGQRGHGQRCAGKIAWIPLDDSLGLDSVEVVILVCDFRGCSCGRVDCEVESRLEMYVQRCRWSGEVDLVSCRHPPQIKRDWSPLFQVIVNRAFYTAVMG